jgi:ABC-type branched-subunit amino acid transport system permease subunit
MATVRRVGALRAGVALTLVLLVLVPFILPESWVSLVNEMLIMALAGCALNLMLGYAGMVSFGPAGPYGIGAYTTALLLTRFHASFVVAFVAAPVVAALLGAIVGWFCVRRTAVYFALLTLAFAQIIWTVIFQWYDFTNGDNGIASIPIPDALDSITRVYLFSVAIVALCLFALWRIAESPFGATLKAIRENAMRTEFIAVPVRRYQLAVFVISSFFLGVAGALFCVFAGSVFPAYAHWVKSTDMLVVCLLGGIHYFGGPIVGSGVYVILEKLVSRTTTYWMFFFGIIVMALVLYMRDGVVGFLMARAARARRGPVAA